MNTLLLTYFDVISQNCMSFQMVILINHIISFECHHHLLSFYSKMQMNSIFKCLEWCVLSRKQIITFLMNCQMLFRHTQKNPNECEINMETTHFISYIWFCLNPFKFVIKLPFRLNVYKLVSNFCVLCGEAKKKHNNMYIELTVTIMHYRSTHINICFYWQPWNFCLS